MSVSGIAICEGEEVDFVEHTFWLDFPYQIGVNFLKQSGGSTLRCTVVLLLSFGQFTCMAKIIAVNVIQEQDFQSSKPFPCGRKIEMSKPSMPFG